MAKEKFLERMARITPEHLQLVKAYMQNKPNCIRACISAGYGSAFIGKLSMLAHNFNRDLEQTVEIVSESDDLCGFCDRSVRCRKKCSGLDSSYADKIDVEAGEEYTAADLLERIRRTNE